MSNGLDEYLPNPHPRPMSCEDLGTRGVGRLADYISTLNLATSDLETRLLLVRARAHGLKALYDALPRELPPRADAALVELVNALADREE